MCTDFDHDHWREMSCMTTIIAEPNKRHLQSFRPTLLCTKKEMENILVPCDFSKPAEEAFKFAVSIASQNKGNIHVLYVIDMTFMKGNPTLANSYAFNVSFLKEIEKEVEQKFQVMWGKHAPLTMPVKFTHTVSSLTSEVEDYIAANKIDLVIMGTHGEGNASFGSNTEKIVRNSPVPVLSVRSAPHQIKNIVVPLLPDQKDDHFIRAVQELQNFFGAKVHLLYINTPLFFRSDDDSNSALSAFAHEKRFRNFTTNIRSDYNLEAGISGFAKEIGADMIALGTHAWKGLAHFFIGSTAEDLVNHISIPLWTLRLNQ
jgi:nucleotide-binding universal stress UspA family protein